MYLLGKEKPDPKARLLSQNAMDCRFYFTASVTAFDVAGAVNPGATCEIDTGTVPVTPLGTTKTTR